MSDLILKQLFYTILTVALSLLVILDDGRPRRKRRLRLTRR